MSEPTPRPRPQAPEIEKRTKLTREQCINDLRLYQRRGYEWMADAADFLEADEDAREVLS